jgi:hypothetical protein
VVSTALRARRLTFGPIGGHRVKRPEPVRSAKTTIATIRLRD